MANKNKKGGDATQNGKKLRTMHLESFFQTGLSNLEADERRRRLFEAEDERDRKIMEEIIRKQRELEDKALQSLAAHLNKAELERIQLEKQRLEEERKLVELRLEDRKTNDRGKQVLTNLYVGGELAAMNKQWLTNNNIKAILNCTINLPNHFENESSEEGNSEQQQSTDGEEKFEIEYKRLDLEDSNDEDISIYFDSATQWIHTHLTAARGILVHCKEGRSRSCAIVLSYLMQKSKKTLTEAYKHVMSVRPLISVNDGYMQHLKQLNLKLYGNTEFNVKLSEITLNADGSVSIPTLDQQNGNNNNNSDTEFSDESVQNTTPVTSNNETPTKKGSLSRQMRELEQSIASSNISDSGLRRSSRSSRSTTTYDEAEGDFFAALEETNTPKKSPRKKLSVKRNKPTPLSFKSPSSSSSASSSAESQLPTSSDNNNELAATTVTTPEAPTAIKALTKSALLAMSTDDESTLIKVSTSQNSNETSSQTNEMQVDTTNDKDSDDEKENTNNNATSENNKSDTAPMSVDDSNSAKPEKRKAPESPKPSAAKKAKAKAPLQANTLMAYFKKN